MNVPVLEVSEQEARRKLAALRGRLHKDAEAEYVAIRKAYEAVEQGGKLVDVDAAIRHGGFDEKMRPRIAIARADRKVVSYRCYRSDEGLFLTHNGYERRYPALENRIRLAERCRESVHAFARVPLVPADVRPATGQLRDWHVLFEVDQWFERHPDRVSRDPYLLKHVAGSLYVVLAEWDLTDLEIAVLSARARRN